MLWKAIAELVLPAGGGGDSGDADSLVQRVVQSLQPSGFFPWQLCNTSLGPDDANSLEFTSLALGIILRGHASQLGAATVSSATASIPSILSALTCDVTTGCARSPRGSTLSNRYTNIWLSNAAAQLILSGVAGLDAKVAGDALSQGIGELTSWNDLARTSGVIEYDSPTYYSADLEALEPAYVFAGMMQRRVLQQALDRLWGDIADDYFPARESLSGAHSRNYDFVTGYGGIDWFTYMLGWRPDAPQTAAEPAIERAILLELLQHTDAYAPGAAIVAANATCAPKVVKSLWGDPADGATRYNQITSGYALSSVSAGYGPQDQQFVAEIGDHDLPVISVVVDDTNDPYGDQKVTTGLFKKPVHLLPRPLGVQRNGDLFGMLEITPSLTSSSLATNIVFPLGASTVLLDSMRINASTQTVAVSTASVLGVRDGSGCVATRILMADPYGSAGQAPIQLVVDPAGLALNVGRLVAYHALPTTDGSPVACTAAAWTAGTAPVACQPRAAVLITAAACANDGDLLGLMVRARNATVTTTDATQMTWSASLGLGGSTFVGGRNRSNGQIVAQSIDAVSMNFASSLSLNGVNFTGTPPPLIPAMPARVESALGLILAALGAVALRGRKRKARDMPRAV
jgi:hypothetical protein